MKNVEHNINMAVNKFLHQLWDEAQIHNQNPRITRGSHVDGHNYMTITADFYDEKKEFIITGNINITLIEKE